MNSGSVIFSGSASRDLAQSVCKCLKKELGNLETNAFQDGETWVKVNDNVRGKDVFVIQSTSQPVNEHLMELLLIFDALKRASADRITAVVPYFGYARQDKKDQGRVALSAKLVADMVMMAGASRLVTIDLHSGQIQGFFNIPVDHLFAGRLLADHVLSLGVVDPTVVSPDVGNVKMARRFAQWLDAPLAIVDKRRPEPNISEVMHIIGEVENRDVFMFDDMIDTAGTIVNAAAALRERGAKKVYACCTHPVFSGDALERIEKSLLTKVIVTDTIPISKRHSSSKIEVVSVAPLLGEAIRRIHNQQSVSALFS